MEEKLRMTLEEKLNGKVDAKFDKKVEEKLRMTLEKKLDRKVKEKISNKIDCKDAEKHKRNIRDCEEGGFQPEDVFVKRTWRIQSYICDIPTTN